MRNGFLAAALTALTVAGLARAQIGYGPTPAAPGGTYPMWPGGSSTEVGGPAAAPMPGPPDGGGIPAPNYPPPYGRPTEGYGVAQDDGSCGGGCGLGCGLGCWTPNSCFLSTDFLLYWLKPSGAHFPLVTSGTGASLGQPGVSGTTVVFDKRFDVNPMPGIRATAGKFFGDDQSWGVDLGGFWLPKAKDNFATQSDLNGSPLLARPFFNVLNETPSSLLISAPGFVAGGIDMRYFSQLWGANTDLLCRLCCFNGLTVFGTMGVRYLELEEKLEILQSTNILPGQQAPFAGARITGPNTIFVMDRFYTKNLFGGGTVGGQMNYTAGKFFCQAGVNVAFGVVHQIVDISGESILAQRGANPPVVATGGLFATTSNIGHFNEDHFMVIPELQVRVGYRICDRVSAYVGYDLLYLSNVVRPADQLDPQINSGLLPTSAQFGTTGPAQPRVLFERSEAYLHGFVAGVTLTY